MGDSRVKRGFMAGVVFPKNIIVSHTDKHNRIGYRSVHVFVAKLKDSTTLVATPAFVSLPATVNWFSNDDLERIASGNMFVHSSRFPSRLWWRV